MNIYNYGFQDGTNTYPLLDDLQTQIDNININIDDKIIFIYNEIDTDHSNLYSSNLYINNSNILGEIRFYTLEAKNFNDPHYDYQVKIGYNGKLYLYHNYDPITSILYLEGWKDIDSEISQLFGAKTIFDAYMIYMEGRADENSTLIGNIMYTSLPAIQGAIGNLTKEVENLQIEVFVEKNKDFLATMQALIPQIDPYAIASSIKSFSDNLLLTITREYGVYVGGTGFVIGGMAMWAEYERNKQAIVNRVKYINSSNFSNISPSDNINLINYTSNILLGEISNEQLNNNSNLNYHLGFTTQKQVNTITNDVLDNFIDTTPTNNIIYSSLNSYPSKIPTTIYTTTTQKVLGQWNAKKRFNLDYTGISYGVGDYYLYYNTASANTFINCFDGNNSTYGEFSSIYTANVYDDYLNALNVYTLGDFSDRGNVLIIQLPYKISLNSVSMRSASGYIGCPMNYSIYGANDLDIFYKLHQTIDLTPATDYPSPNYTNTQILSQDSAFYNTFGFIFKKAYSNAPRVYEIKLYGYEVSSRRTLIRNNVGIGENNPNEKLHIGGNTKIDGYLYVSSNIGLGTTLPDEKLHIIGNAQIDGSIYTYNILTNSLISTSNVGIGTYNPTEMLDVVGNIKSSLNVNSSTLTTNSINSLIYLGTNVGIGTTTTSYKLEVNGSLKSSSLQTNSINSTIYIDSNNNVGIGVTNPNFFNKLEVEGDVKFKGLNCEISYTNKGGIIIASSGMTTPIGNNNSGTINFVNHLGTYLMSIGDCAEYGYTTNYFDIIYNSPILGLFNKGNFICSGNVGIGHTNSVSNPTEKLDVIGNVKVSNNILCSGNIGIGVTNPSNKLEVSTTAKFADITLTSYIDCYRNTTGSPSLGIYGSTADRLILQRGTISTHPYSIGIGTNCTYYNVPYLNNHSFMVNGVEKFAIKGSGMLVNGVNGTDIFNIMNNTFSSGIGIGTNTISSISDVADSITIKSKLTGDINLMVNNATKLCVDGSTGYVGINNTDPYYQLDVNGSLYATSINSGGSFGIYYANPELVIKSTGESQSSKLYLSTPTSGSSAIKCALIAEGINSYGRSKLHFCLENTANNTAPTYNASLSHSRMTITNDGYVGIGSTTPITNLEVVGNINATAKYLCTNTSTNTPQTGTWGGTGDRVFLYQGNTGVHPYSLGINASTLWYSVPTGAKHSFYVNGTEYLTINTGGSLNVVSNDTYIAQFRHTNLTQGIGIGYNNIDAIGSGTTQNITIKSKSTGNIYFNTNATTQMMVSGTGGVEIQYYLKVYSDTSSISGSIATYITNTAVNFSTTSFTATDICAEFGSSIWIYNNVYVSSDERIKKDILDLNQDDALNKILKLKPKSYKYIDVINNGNSTNYGFIAQDVKDVIEEAVSYKKSFISNIYEVGSYDNGLITLNKNITDILKIDDKLKIYDDKGIEVICNITEILNHNSFKIDNKKLNCNKVLVYGTEIDDFNVLDKELLFSLNISATQKLYEIINNLQKRITDLESVIRKL